MADAPKLKPMAVGEILDASFRLYRENWLKFVAILAVAYVPITLLSMALLGVVFSNMPTPVQMHEGMTQEQMAAAMQSQMKAVLPGLIAMGATLILFSLIAQPLATGAITRAVGARYLNEEISVGNAYRAIGGMFFKYLGSILLAGLVIGLGMMLCIVPGLIFATWFAFISQAVVLEGLGGTKAMGRSRDLTRGFGLRVFGYLVLVFVLSAGIGWVLGFVGQLITTAITSNLVASMLLQQAFGQVINLFIMPYFSIVMILLYYDLRVRKEAFDLEILSKNLSAGASPPA
jgi:hypothetical protein